MDRASLFTVGELYSHDCIMDELGIGNSGGIRVSLTSKKEVARVVLFSTSEQGSNVQDNPYSDRAEGRILSYTGTGKIGDQNLTGQNLRMTQQGDLFFPIYVFSLLSHRKSRGSPEKRWKFGGIYKFLDYARETQSDLLGAERAAWVYTLLKLDFTSAGPQDEPAVRNGIRQAFADPMFSAHHLLGAARQFTAAQIQRTVSQLNRLEPFAFEFFLKKVLIASDFRDVRVTKSSSDGGVDVIARLPTLVWPIDGQIIQIQAKRWQRPIGRREVAELRGSLLPRAIGVMITTGNCARTAITEAERPNLLPISLVDGHKLATTVMRLSLAIP